jgi:dipeptidyl aminopeptidase/acylaminoacyl peptidase
MDDLRELVTEAVRHVRAAPEDLERTMERVRARQRTRRVATATTALLVAAGGIGIAWWAFVSGQETTPATPAPEHIVYTTQGPDDMMPLIAIMDADGSSAQILGPGVEPAWSPDGSMIAFKRSSEDGSTGIYVMSANGTDVRRLTMNPSGEDENPSWSPDGSTIAFSRSTFVTTTPDPVASRAHRDIYIVNPDGANLTEWIGGPTDDFAPDWMPDGTGIAFIRVEDPASQGAEGTPQVWMLRRGDREPVQLTHLEQGPYRFDWSPDGSRLVLDAACDLYVVDPDRDDASRITLERDVACPYDAAWSPDGTRFVFTGGPDDDHDVYVANIDGSGVIQLTGPDSHDNDPSWIAASRESASATPTPTDAESPSVSQCFGSRSLGDFDGDGQIDTVKLHSLVPLPKCGPEAVQTEWRVEVTVDLASGTFSFLFDDCEKPFDCTVLEGSDVDGDGRAELPITLGPGAQTYVGMYRVTETGVHPLALAPPGDPTGGSLEPGPIRLGGPSDAIWQTGFECRTLDGDSRVLVAWSAQRDDGVSPWRVHFTTLELQDDVFEVVGTEDREGVVDLPPVWGTCP